MREKEEEKLDIPVAIITDLDIKDNHNCKGIVLGTKNLNLLSEFFKSKNWNKDLSSLKDEIFFSKDELKMQLKEFMKKNRLPNDSEDLINKEIEETDINIEKYREIKRNKKIEEYSIDNIRAFINKKQTLEYDILMGNLCEKFYRAILLTKKKDDNKIDEEIERIKSLDCESRAKEIFKENFYSNYEKNQKSKLSKAEVALNFSYILKNEEPEQITKEIFKDEYVRYIVEAIEYVTKRKNSYVNE